MLQRGSAAWAGAAGVAIVVAGVAALNWTHAGFFWPVPGPGAVADRAPESLPVLPGEPAPVVANPEPVAASAAPTPNSVRPAFDIVNVEPTGEAVVAGRAAPNAKVELRDAGKTVAEATTDNSGQFVMIPPALAPGDHSLSLATGTGASEAQTSSAIVVAVPTPPARVELNAASAGGATSTPSPAAPVGKPTATSAPDARAAVPTPPAKAALAAASPAAPAEKPAAPDASARLVIRSVEFSAGGRLAAKGAADPDAVVRLYLNGAFVADAKTNADGHWSLTVEHGMTAGAYVVRADEIDSADAKVVARVEAPFSYPAAPAPSAANPSPSVNSPVIANAAPTAPSPADVVVDSVRTARVARGDTLWAISNTYYGDGARYRLIFAANSNQIRNPNLIYPGQLFVVPKPEMKP